MNLTEYLESDEAGQSEICAQIEKNNPGFRFLGLGKQGDLLPTFQHIDSQIEVKFIPSGRYVMGFSPEEEAQFKKLAPEIDLDPDCMRPTHEESVRSLFISVYPVLPRQYKSVTGSEYPDAKYAHGNPVNLKYEETEVFLHCIGARLPTEVEWEYCCRGGTQSLFYFGDEVPAPELLEQYVSEEFDKEIDFKANQFGLYGLFTGEWCSDDFAADYRNETVPERGMKVFRAEGSARWPWQYPQEWIFCISAFRSSSPKENFFKEELLGKPKSVSIIRSHSFRTVWAVNGF
ncbi:MAG: formylglycine-generating enzyme family protein [Gimesia chilikensis]|uniref:formylglycine-generating enzyme family protein n=1 Tax=Gimesia chilikensis TaxID=2605989 RepID=UPI0037B556B3